MDISQTRNEMLSKVFCRLKHIESYGSGLKQIMQLYEDLDVKLEIFSTHGRFR